MTKTKKQLRAEAVERLRKYNEFEAGTPLIFYAIGEIPRSMDDACEILIDLLTDDEETCAERADAYDDGVGRSMTEYDQQTVTPNAEPGGTCNESGENVTDANDKLPPENGVRTDDVDANDGNADSREKLEACADDIAGAAYGAGFTNGLKDAWNEKDGWVVYTNRIIVLLDRQAAITERANDVNERKIR